MKESIVCSVCGASLQDEPIHDVGGRILCDDCFCEHTVVCDNCGDRIMRNEADGDNMVTLCRYCYEYNYTRCEECGCLVNNDDARYDDDSDYAYCEDCYRRMNAKSIKPYLYKPEPIFYGSGNLFMGVELEIDDGGEFDENAQELEELANRFGVRIYCKHDGSINDGFEVVSHPMTLDYHKNEMNWQEVFEKAVRLGCLSHKTSSCGLHVHVNRSALGKDYIEQEASIGRIVFFIEKHWNELVKFSRRKQENIDRWAARYETISSTTKETYKKAKDKHLGRYVAVNLNNYSTIEFRLFRGTLRHKTFLASLELVERICTIATRLTDKEVEEMTWGEFVMGIDENQSPELIEYLKAKRLYVNEIMEESVEV